MKKIVWNGCDEYVEVEKAVSRGYEFDGDKLYHGAQEFSAFEVIEINPAGLPKDEDGEPIFDGVLGSETGLFYRSV